MLKEAWQKGREEGLRATSEIGKVEHLLRDEWNRTL
jgi:hypothetical protein